MCMYNPTSLKRYTVEVYENGAWDEQADDGRFVYFDDVKATRQDDLNEIERLCQNLAAVRHDLREAEAHLARVLKLDMHLFHPREQSFRENRNRDEIRRFLEVRGWRWDAMNREWRRT